MKVHTHRITADPAHLFPWRWYFTLDTPVGHLSDEGLAATEGEAVEDAVRRFEQLVDDKYEARRTASEHHFVVVFNETDETVEVEEV